MRDVRLFIFIFFQKFEFTNFKFINLFASFEIKISNFEIYCWKIKSVVLLTLFFFFKY